MSIIYPLSLPTNRGFASIHMQASSVVGVSQSPFTFSQQVQVFPGQQWSIDVTLPPMKRVDSEVWKAFLLSLNGRQGTFLCGDPLGKNPQGIATGTPVVSGGSQTGNQLVTSGWTVSTSGILKAGDYIGLVTGPYRLYKVLTDVGTDSSGNATLDIWPTLREPPLDGLPIVTVNALGQFRLTTSMGDWQSSTGSIDTIAFSASEAL